MGSFAFFGLPSRGRRRAAVGGPGAQRRCGGFDPPPLEKLEIGGPQNLGQPSV